MARATPLTSFDSERAWSAAIATNVEEGPPLEGFARGEHRCDACDAPLDEEDDDRGMGVYVWARGGEVRRDHVPLCGLCSKAIYAMALGVIFSDED